MQTNRQWGAAFAALLAFWVVLASLPAAAFETSRIVIETESGTHPFTVEMAVTAQERGRGLMYRQSMADDAGMLFDFGVDEESSMWMKNTYISLDMVFIKADGTVHRIARSTTPFSLDIVSSKGPVRSVLELNAGIADRIGLKRGDIVRHEMFGNAE
ncbi:DUF192 domain-containing protein [Microbaculum marinisediminis]|uniref:DUF192 domain-containing protein n=1 Tax=Microbaculum marinisediminis TaxID=2931392 RepID=A0AAW5QYQ6_9HYPH|nr:DUF192 domain-containing protein [Microbaculum sp. A6E488]MCT8973110.1 DUF192 domain-containing protein [Microbaculum sp. A6E488]